MDKLNIIAENLIEIGKSFSKNFNKEFKDEVDKIVSPLKESEIKQILNILHQKSTISLDDLKRMPKQNYNNITDPWYKSKIDTKESCLYLISYIKSKRNFVK